VSGAGVLLGRDYVLTCAHVATNAGSEIMVDAGGMARTPSVHARIDPEHHVPATEDWHGDVTLLRLDQPLIDRSGTTLRRVALSWDRTVRAYGYPDGLENIGVWAHALITGDAGPGGAWRQLNTRPGEQRIRRGFSGAGVIDDETGDVLGIVVSEFNDQSANVSWMIPIETILRDLPRVKEWVTGDPAADEVFSGPVSADVDGDAKAHEILNWLSRRGTGDVVLIVVGDASALRWAVALSGGERSAHGEDPAGPSVAVGSIDLALDASGKTEEQVSHRIVERAGVSVDDSASCADRVRAGIPPMTVVVDGVDDAQRPEALLNRVLRPLAEQGSRLLLGFRRESSPSLAVAQSWEVGSIDHRLERLAEKTRALVTAEREIASSRAQVRDGATVTFDDAGKLLNALAALRVTAARDPELTRHPLETCERMATRALRDAEAQAGFLAGQLAECHELRGRLEAYRAKAIDHGLVEDIELAAVHRKAHELLEPPADVPAARVALCAYQMAVRNAIHCGENGQR
jgi:hypothetical protein